MRFEGTFSYVAPRGLRFAVSPHPRLSILAAGVVLGLAGVSAMPAHAANSLWDHNGSQMTLEENGGKRRLVYTEPREGLDKAGIRQGTVLFDGQRKSDGRLSGFAKIFKGNCNPVEYFVEGTLDAQRGEMTLQGQAPMLSGKGCEVSGYTDSGPASTLTFKLIGDIPETAATAQRAPDLRIEQGDGGPAGGYLPPASGNDRYAGRPQADTQAAPERERAQRQAEDDDPDSDTEDSRPLDRRYSRAPAPYDERPGSSRYPRSYDPNDDVDEDGDTYDNDDDRPSPRYWRRPY